jgi:hypothetical protein
MKDKVHQSTNCTHNKGASTGYIDTEVYHTVLMKSWIA